MIHQGSRTRETAGLSDSFKDDATVDASPRTGRSGVEPLMTLREVAATLQVSEKTVRRLVASRRLPCLRVGRQLRFAPSDLLRWVSARTEV